MAESAATETTPSQGNKKRPLPLRIAVDGSAASGKSTVGRRLAQRLGYAFLDTGVMYRAVTWAALNRGVNIEADAALTNLANDIDIKVSISTSDHEPAHIYIDSVDVTDLLRSTRVEDSVSLVSRVAGVREALVAHQRKIASEQPIVMAGRDIGTVVLPDADLKLYLDASLEERARRRHADFVGSGHDASADVVLEDIRRRDQIDTERAVSPLRPADDAVIIGTDGLDLDQVMARVFALVEDAG